MEMVLAYSAAAFALGWGTYDACKWGYHHLNQVNEDEIDEIKIEGNPAREEGKGRKREKDVYVPDRPLPLDEKYKRPIPDANAEGAHTQLGTRDGRKGKYPQAREFDKDGKEVRDIDFTDHGRPVIHPNPHQHRWEINETGGTLKRGPQPDLLEGWKY